MLKALFLITLSVLAFGQTAKILRNKNCDCGIPEAKPKLKSRIKRHHPEITLNIINGMDADANEYPWLVGLYINRRCRGIPVCGGTVISSHHILTAAHCVEGKFGTFSEYSKSFHIDLYCRRNDPMRQYG